MGEVLATYPSSSNPDVTYNIIKGADSVYYCSCQGWKMRKNCKHLKDYMASSGQSTSSTLPVIPILTTSKSIVPAMPIPKTGPMISGKIDPNTFKSDAFQSLPFYQGCGGQVQGDINEIIATLDKMEATNQYVIEPKYDGVWCAAFSDGEKIRFWSRNMKEKTYGLNDWKFPAGMLLVGELGFGSEHALQRRAKYGFDFMDVFDLLVDDYQAILDQTDDERHRRLFVLMNKLDFNTRERFRLAPRYANQFSSTFKSEHEGLVLKTVDQLYTGRGTKVSHWIKAKKWMTIEMVIMSYVMSKAETKKGLIESITCGAYVNGKLVPLVKVGSMPSEWQKEFAENFEAYKGKVVELAHFAQFSSGSLRHPSFVRMREDKEAHECVFERKK